MKSRIVNKIFAVSLAALALAVPARAKELALFQSYTNTDWASFGIGGLRNVGAGSIQVTNVSGTITKAYLYWHGYLNTANGNAVDTATFKGTTISGTSIGLSGPNCWTVVPNKWTLSQAFRADVTSLVTGNGSYSFGNSSILGVNVNGASLVVIYNDGNPNNNRDMTIFDGNDSTSTSLYDAPGWNVLLGNINYTAGQTVKLQFHVSDSQIYDDDDLIMNGGVLAFSGSIFNGDTVPSAGGGFSDGALWDITNFDVTSYLIPGINSLAISTGQLADCLSLVAIVVDAPRGSAPPPPPPNNHPPTITTMQPIVIPTRNPNGVVYTVPANVQDIDGNFLTVIWRLNGASLPIQTDNISSGGLITSASLATTRNFPIGNSTINITVSDGIAGPVNTTTTVTVVLDVIPPIVVNCGPILFGAADANGQSGLPDFTANVTATDNFTPVSLLVKTQSPDIGTLVPAGLNPVVLTVTDQAGNTTSCTNFYSVADQTPPVIACGGNLRAATFNNAQVAIPSVLSQVVASDNVTATSLLILSQVPTAGTLVGVGTNAITVTAADAAGNTASCLMLYIVTNSASSGAPTLCCGVDVGQLWPPNHFMVNVGYKAFGTNLVGAVKIDVFSNEDDLWPAPPSSNGGNNCNNGGRDDDNDNRSGSYGSRGGDDDNRSNCNGNNSGYGGNSNHGSDDYGCGDRNYSYSHNCYGFDRDDDYNCNGDGSQFSPDAMNLGGAGGLTLRAERDGNGPGRVYLIIATAKGLNGQTKTCTATVTVPHDQSRASLNSIASMAAAAKRYFDANGVPPSGYYRVGDGPTIHPKNWNAEGSDHGHSNDCNSTSNSHPGDGLGQTKDGSKSSGGCVKGVTAKRKS